MLLNFFRDTCFPSSTFDTHRLLSEPRLTAHQSAFFCVLALLFICTTLCLSNFFIAVKLRPDNTFPSWMSSAQLRGFLMCALLACMSKRCHIFGFFFQDCCAWNERERNMRVCEAPFILVIRLGNSVSTQDEKFFSSNTWSRGAQS